MSRFQEVNPSLESYWRSIILFGRNVASYKFALAKALLEFDKESAKPIKMEEIALPFAKHVCSHLRLCDKQATSRSSRFLENCRRYNQNEINETELQEQAVRLGFVNVIDAFHVVNNEEIPLRFFEDKRNSNGGIILTDNLYRLYDSIDMLSFPEEVEARWRLVETAWELNIATNLLTVDYDTETAKFFTGNTLRRKSITSSRNALNGYQKGKCFYCNTSISLDSGGKTVDVDHFFPHALKTYETVPHIDGVWNLVLACQECNRGEHGKFAKLPSITYLDKLHRRNNYLISSHHPLRETLMRQMGTSEKVRAAFLQKAYTDSRAILIHTWSPTDSEPDIL